MSTPNEAFRFLMKRYLEENLPDDPAGNYVRAMMDNRGEKAVETPKIAAPPPVRHRLAL